MMMTTHFVHGLLALPIVIDLFEKELNERLFLLATTSELTMEIEDIINRIYRRLNSKYPEIEEPNTFIIGAFFHHILAFITVIPANRYYLL